MKVKNVASLLAVGLVTGLSASAQAGVIIFNASSSDPRDRDTYVWVMNDDGTNKVQLASTRLAFEPNVSPDGTKIVFSKYIEPIQENKGRGLFIVNVDGSDLRQVTNAGNEDGQPMWSPDGTRIAFTRCERESYPDSFRPPFNIFVIDADGSNLTRITNTGENSEPAWSPDGTKLAYIKYTETPNETPNFRYTFHIANADGSYPITINYAGEGVRWPPLESRWHEARILHLPVWALYD
jgi:Tol biopolymer transport system component